MRPVRVVIADGGILPRGEILHLAERAGFDVVGEGVDWAAISDLVDSRAADLVLVNGEPEFAGGIRTLAHQVASVVIAPTAIAAKEYCDAGASAVIMLESDPDLISASVQIAIAYTRQLADARKETAKLRDQLDTRKVVERAKGVLMNRLGISEDAAYRKMQRASQEENKRMREIAESILSAERLYAEPKPDPL